MTTLTTPEPAIRFCSLGDQVISDIERYCVFGPGSLQGQPARLDAEKREFVRKFYRLYPTGHVREGERVYDRCAVELRKGLAKTELAAWICFVELHPWSHVRFNGFDDAGNLLPGRPVRSPYIPMLAVTEGQVQELAFGVLKYIVEHCDTAELFGVSLDRITRLDEDGTNAGMAVAVSNAPGTRDGARTTFQHFDEPHWLILPRDKESVELMLRNAGKRQMETPWSLFTSTAGTPGLNSVEEDIRTEAEQIADGRKLPGESNLFFFARWAGPAHDLTTQEGRIAAITEAQGPAGEWSPGQFARAALDYDRVGCNRALWERLELNRWTKSNAGAFDTDKVRELMRPAERIAENAFVTVGFDGSRRKDSTAIVITEITTGKQELVGLWDKPDDAGENWEVDADAVHAIMAHVFTYYEVWQAYCDPYWWPEDVATWMGQWPGHVVETFTGSNNTTFARNMARAYKEAIDSGAIVFVGALVESMFTHIAHAGRKELPGRSDDDGEPLWILQKLDGLRRNRFDACMAGNLSWQARLDAIAKDAKAKRGATGRARRLY